MQQKLIIFIKAPRPGHVKTRLAHTLGDRAATAAYCQLVEALRLALGPISTIEFRFTPDDAEAEIIHWLRSGWTAVSQGPGDLGERMKRAFADSFAAGSGRVVIIGSDCPTITPDDINRAWTALATHDVVLGPARDGGYWLIGLSSAQPRLFENIPWSTEQVYASTLARAAQAGLGVFPLEERNDVDTAADWQEYLQTRANLLDRKPGIFGCDI